ncbi:MAG TPA: APC family permease [Bryobacteraceae bacterium]|nr:APC family permease [Bryobacteraceae bacterium]
MSVESAALADTPSGLRRELRLKDLVFFNICAIVSLRWVAAAAHAGPGSFVLWVVAAIFFFLPSAVVIARLSQRFPEEGGMYIWTKHAFGDRHGFLCGWIYFISTILYFPSLLLAGVTMTTFALGDSGQHLAENRAFALPVTLAVLWIGFTANFFGLKVAKWISAFGGSSTFIIGALISGLAIAAWLHSGAATTFYALPKINLDTLNFWSQIAFAFVGLELAPIVSAEIRNPRRDLPRAGVISGILSVLFYIAVTAALLIVLPPADISPMTGLAQAGVGAARKLGASMVALLFAPLLGITFLGQLDTWIAGNTRLPYAIGLDNYLPASFKRIHPRYGTPYVSLIVQAVAATLFLLMAQFGETVRAAYQIMVDMTLIVTFIPFLYIFAAGFRFTSRIAAISGLFVTIIAIVLSALPPPEVASTSIFEFKIIGGSLFFIVLGLLMFKRYQTARSRMPAQATVS